MNHHTPAVSIQTSDIALWAGDSMVTLKLPVVAKKSGKARTALLVGALAGLSLITGCASKEQDIDLASYVDTIEPADTLYNQGLANLEAGRLKEASAKFAAIDRQHPYSEYARKALVMSAFTNYRQGNYDEAINMARRYVSLYPTSEEAAYAYYIAGLSY